jgi:CheY-like chemotaxis protein
MRLGVTVNGTGLEQSHLREIFPAWRLSAPSDAAGNGRTSGAAPQGPGPLSGSRVLVVEDEFFVGLEIAETLEAAGASIAGPAWTLADAERMAADGGIDMAVLDVNLDGQYAIDLGIGLKRQGVRVVFVTAHVDDASMFPGEAASIPRLGKPASSRALLRALVPAT